MKNTNTGVDNTGNRNSGHLNSGDLNSGNRNSGDLNSGNRNSGNRNSGNRNSGNWNSGSWNSGDLNSGNWNTGNWNSGSWNSGDLNSGNRNSGNWNSGSWNSGDWNTGHWNSGCFNTNEPKMRLFNKECDMTVSEFYEQYDVYADIPLNRWIDSDKVTDEEKKNVKNWEQMGGYLKTLDFKEACQVWWNENPDEHKRFLELPNFDAAIFKEITGIDVDTDDEVDVTVEGRTTRISRKSAIALGLLK